MEDEVVVHLFKHLLPLLNLKGDQVKQVGKKIRIPYFNENDIIHLLELSAEQMRSVGPLVHVTSPITIIGDLHGNFHDLLRILTQAGSLMNQKFLFLGDYVDRGSFSIEVLVIMCTLFMTYPNNFYFIRGNHEFKEVNKSYGFYDEVVERYMTEEIYEKANIFFTYLPVAAIVDDTYFAVHGGIGPDVTLNAVRNLVYPIEDFCENPIVEQLVWSDPSDKFRMFSASQRGKGSCFGEKAIFDFLMSIDCKGMFRAHECVQYGLSQLFKDKVVTVFSCSGYLGNSNNGGFLYLQSANLIRPMTLSPDKFPKRDSSLYYEAGDAPPIKSRLCTIITTKKIGSASSTCSRFRLNKCFYTKISSSVDIKVPLPIKRLTPHSSKEKLCPLKIPFE